MVAHGQAQFDCLHRMESAGERVVGRVPPTWQEMGTEHLRADAFRAVLHESAYLMWLAMLDARDKLPTRYASEDYNGFRVLTLTRAALARKAGLTIAQAAEGIKRLHALKLMIDCDGARVAMKVGTGRERVIPLAYSSFGRPAPPDDHRIVWRRVVFGAQLERGTSVIVPTAAAEAIRAVRKWGGARPGHKGENFKLARRAVAAIVRAYDSCTTVFTPPAGCPTLDVKGILRELDISPGERERWRITTIQPHQNFDLTDPAQLAAFCAPTNFKWEQKMSNEATLKPRGKARSGKQAKQRIEDAFGPMICHAQPPENTSARGSQDPAVRGSQDPAPSKSNIEGLVFSSLFLSETPACAGSDLEEEEAEPAGADLFTNPAPVLLPPPEFHQKWLAFAPPYPSIAVRLTTIPAPPLLSAEATGPEMVDQLISAYRAACGNRYGKKCWAFSRFDTRSAKIQKSAQYASLLAAAQVMREQEIRPASWAAWCCDVWKNYGSKAAFPPVKWMFDCKRLIERAGWFRSEEPCSGGRVLWSPQRQTLHAAWDAMDQALRRCWTEDAAKRCVAYHCSETKWDEMCEAARKRGEEDLALVMRAIARGEFVW